MQFFKSVKIFLIFFRKITKNKIKVLTNTYRGYIIKIPLQGMEVINTENNKCCCGEKHTFRDEEDKKRLLNRLKRIEGQVRGIQSIIEKDAYCIDILIQSAAINAAVNAFNKEILSCHIHTCVARDIREGKDEVIDELTATIQKLMR